jgi:type IV pilus assembly protein PilM
MLKTKSFLSIDLGAGCVKVAEFDQTDSGSLVLKKFGQHALGLPGAQDAVREGVVKKALQSLVNEQGFSTKQINVCAPGYQVFSKFVKLPPVDSSKVTQIIQYEAQQNVPFPLDEVVWDYQIMGTSPGGELEVLLVAIKTELVDKVFKAAENHGMVVNLVDVSQAAICNAFRYNYGDLEGCTMLLDIGAKSSNLLFFEKGKVFARSINIGANSITQEFSTEAKMRFPEAEKFKIEQGFVSLGGAYEDPDNPQQAQISKIARQVMTRLHIQVNQTMQFYRSQQGGSAPDRLFLAGGASIMPYTAQFFAEKLNVEVEYFNPFRAVEIDPSINLEELARVAHSFGEVVGLGLRNVVQCPVELNLMPKSSLQRQEFNRKKPYLISAVFGLVLVVASIGLFFSQVHGEKQRVLNELRTIAAPLQSLEQQLRPEESALETQLSKAEIYGKLLNQRYLWSDLLKVIRGSLVEAENEAQRRFSLDSGLWIESLLPDSAGIDLTGAAETFDDWDDEEEQTPMMDIEMMKRYGLIPMGDSGGEDDWDDEEGDTSDEENEDLISKLTLKCRGVNRRAINPNANNNLAFTLLQKLQSQTNYFNADDTKLTGELAPVDEEEGTFDFEISLKLKEPISLVD